MANLSPVAEPASETRVAEPQETWAKEIRMPRFSNVVFTREPGRVPHSSRALGAGSGGFPESKQSSLSVEESASERARGARRRALIIPREHGAWGLLLVPLITGAGVALRENFNLLPFLFLLDAALALLWLRTPLESLLGTSAMHAQTKDERRTVIAAIAALGTVSALSLGALLWAGRNPYLWLMGSAACAAFTGQAVLKLTGRQPHRLSREGEAERPRSTHSTQNLRMLSEIVGTIGLTLSAPAAYYVITGKLGLMAWILWAANLLFAGDQIHYVQLRLHTAKIEGFRAKLARGWAFATGQALLTIALAIAGVGGLLPKFASLAFAPLLFRGWFYFIQNPSPLQVRKLGWSELAHATAFCILLIAVS
jgi:hypothetical protein